VSGKNALDASLRALRHRDLSTVELDRRLEERGFAEREREDALATLTRTKLLDDERFATSRAAALADHGAGDALIRYELARAGIARELVDRAVESLEDETLRARRVVERRGPGPKTARYLGSKGFADDTIGACLADDVDP
jgi:SOS response regulatory protein OraA/RecX